jgi:predicted Rossmann fold nucleotide-binding protein DprA/Smf involved in DNA uptake
VGQLIDLFLIPGMVKAKQNDSPQFLPKEGGFIPIQFSQQVLEKLDRLDEKLHSTFVRSKKIELTPLHRLLEAASTHQNVLSFAQAIMVTGLTPDQVEQVLNEGMRKGIIHIGNDPESGAIRYYFDI